MARTEKGLRTKSMSRIQSVANTEPQEGQKFIGLRGDGFEDYEDARTGENRGRDLGSRFVFRIGVIEFVADLRGEYFSVW